MIRAVVNLRRGWELKVLDKMAPLKTTPVPPRSVWSTAVIFTVLLVLTVAMGFLFKAIVIGSR